MAVSNEAIRARFPDGVFPAACPSRVLLDHVTSKWGVLVLLALTTEEPQRWSELRRRAQGVSEKMLAQTLHQLQADDLVDRKAFAVVPPHVEYSLTDRGREVGALLVPLMEWIADHAEEVVGLSR